MTRTRQQVRHEAALEDLPDGAFVLLDGKAHLVHGYALFPFAPDGYGPPMGRGKGSVTVLTPSPTIEILNAGCVPALHPSAKPG